MTKAAKIALVVVGITLILNGLLNIADDGMMRTYDIASILSGVGFALVVLLMKGAKS